MTDIAASQTVYFQQFFDSRSPGQLFTVVNKQFPAVRLIFCDAAANLVSATMDCDFHCSIRYDTS